MPILSSSNRSQLAYKLEGTYPTNFGASALSVGTNLLMLSESLDYTVKNESSKAIRNDRQVSDTVQVSASSQGGFAFEHVWREYDPFILGVLQANAYTAYGVSGTGSALPAITTFTATSITFTSTTAATPTNDVSALVRGQWFMMKAPAGASAAVRAWFDSHPLRVALTGGTLSITQIPIDTVTPIDTAIVGTSLIAGATIGTAYATHSNVMKSYEIEVQHADISLYRKYKGMVPSKMDLKLSVGSIVTGSFEFMGKSFALDATTGMGSAVASQIFTPANATKGIFDIIEGGASITATTFIKSGDIMIDNALRAQEAIAVFGTAGIGAGTMNITGKLEVYFADATMYAKFIAGSASSLSIPIIDVGGNGYVYYFPRIKYTAAKVATGGLDQDNMLSMDWQALPDVGVGSPTLGSSIVIYRIGA
jgi:hypothetical protein